METFFCVYMATWALACAVALVIYLRDRRSFCFARREYWRFLADPLEAGDVRDRLRWHYLNRPLHGGSDLGLHRRFVYGGADVRHRPWVVGTLYKVARGELPLKQAYVAACVWMFSMSWSYDLYLVLRDGDYPVTWFVNIAASSVLYVSAGLLWNLEWQPNRGVIFAFMRESWPTCHTNVRFGSFSACRNSIT